MKFLKIGLLIGCLLLGGTLWRCVPIQTSSSVKIKKEVLDAKISGNKGHTYNIQTQYLNNKHVRYPSKKERENFTFYLVNGKNKEIKEVSPSFRNVGTYQIESDNENILLIKEDKKQSENGFVGLSLTEEPIIFHTDGMMTKKLEVGHVSFIFQPLYANISSSLVFKFDKKVKVNNVIFLSENLQYLNEINVNKKGTSFPVNVQFLFSGNYMVFVDYKLNGKDQKLSYTVFVNEEEEQK